MSAAQREEAAAQVESLAAIVTHPLRRRIWYGMSERPVSPRELADQLHQPVNDVAYHVRVLRDMGVIELVGTKPVRGATQHFYRAVKRPHLTNEDVAALGPEKAVASAANILQMEFGDAAASLEAGKLIERPEHYVFRLAVTLDEEGWSEFHKILSEAAERLYEAESRSVERRAKNGDESEAVPVVAHLNLFERG